jgi:phage-related protein
MVASKTENRKLTSTFRVATPRRNTLPKLPPRGLVTRKKKSRAVCVERLFALLFCIVLPRFTANSQQMTFQRACKCLSYGVFSLVGVLPQIITSLISAIIGSIPQLIQAGIQLLTSLIKNLPTIIVEVVKAVPQIIAALVKGFTGSIGQIVQVGGNLIKGLWQGISDAGAWLWGKISGFFGGVVDKINAFTS